jgi:hypothetical protein
MPNRAFPAAFLLALIATPAISRPAVPVPTTVTITMADRGFHPQVIRLKAGRLYSLRLVNTDRTGHDLYAPAFFGAARIDPKQGMILDDNRLDVPSHATRSITLMPRAGHYEAKSSKALDAVSNMTAQILVY